MTAQEFLISKGFVNVETDGGFDFTISELLQYLDEYHAIASGQKIDVDKKFENLTEKYLAEQAKKHE